MIKDNFLRKHFVKGDTLREVTPADFFIDFFVKLYFKRLDNRISSWCSKNDIDKSFFLNCTNNATDKTDMKKMH